MLESSRDWNILILEMPVNSVGVAIHNKIINLLSKEGLIFTRRLLKAVNMLHVKHGKVTIIIKVLNV